MNTRKSTAGIRCETISIVIKKWLPYFLTSLTEAKPATGLKQEVNTRSVIILHPTTGTCDKEYNRQFQEVIYCKMVKSDRKKIGSLQNTITWSRFSNPCLF